VTGRLLVLGGTSFVVRQVVEAALDDRVQGTLFSCCLTSPGMFPDCEHRIRELRGREVRER
jgi:hypothetical protein